MAVFCHKKIYICLNFFVYCTMLTDHGNRNQVLDILITVF